MGKKRRSQHMKPTSWDSLWHDAVQSNPSDLQSRTLENEIDRLKLEFLKPVLPISGRAIEVGCGSARLLARVGQHTPLALHALDNSETALRIAAKTSAMTGIPMTLTIGSALSIPYESKSFDMVLSGGLLEHFDNPMPVMKEMVRILRPGGVFYADVVPRRFSIYRIREAWRMIRSPMLAPGVYESHLGPRFYRSALEELACSDIVVRSSGVYPHWNAAQWVRRTQNLDGTWIADVLGWYFMIRGRRQ